LNPTGSTLKEIIIVIIIEEVGRVEGMGGLL
jgi:hypothetical protein